ncbi:interactor of HORMAD1 protein 1 [Eleutherodactylus coqui]|uniref:interactor of HORMAD1 protein 1 n=1 Tax=Eleutherodactylus coqui TaxID=57060 RepID=UPI0034620607
MNLNVWNIKDMFSVPPGAGINKSANRNAAQSDHSSLSDSQFLFGSQFYPDGSQQGSMDYTPQSKYQRNSNQNSQDSEPSMYQKYQVKPPLCSSESKERNTFHAFGMSKHKDIIDQFGEIKKRAKERHESEQLHQLICNIQGSLQNLKVPFFNLEENTNLRCQSILDSINAISKALQEKISSYHESILKAVPLKSDLEQAMLELEKKIQLKDTEMTDLKSNIQLLLLASDAIKSQQSEKHLELSEKLTQLSDFMQSSEQRILSEICKNKWISQPTRSSKDETTQTSPLSVQDPSAKQHLITSVSTCPDGPSPANVPCTCGGISNTLSVRQKGNHCVTEEKGRKILNVTSVQSVRDALADQRKWKKAITVDDPAVTCVHNLQHVRQDDCCMPARRGKPPRNTTEKENQVVVTRSKSENNTLKMPNTNKQSRGLKKKTMKNTKQVPSRAKNSKPALVNKPFSQKQAKSVKATQDCSTFLSQTCASSSIAAIPAPLRKTRKKKSLKFSYSKSQEIAEQSKIKEGSSGDWSRFVKAEQEAGHCEVPSGDSNNPYCSEEDKMVWFPSSSPLHNYSTAHPTQKMGQKGLFTLFFDSSDDTD